MRFRLRPEDLRLVEVALSLRNSDLAASFPKQYVLPFSDFHITEQSVGMCFFVASHMGAFVLELGVGGLHTAYHEADDHGGK